MRRFANGESFFQQQIEAVRGDGDCLLSSMLPGAMEIIDVGTRQYLLNDGTFVAATSGTEMKVRMQNIGNCEVPCDHIPVRSWPFFRAREVLHGVIESIQREQTT